MEFVEPTPGERIELALLRVIVPGNGELGGSDRDVQAAKAGLRSQLVGIAGIHGGRVLTYAGDGGVFMFRTGEGGGIADTVYAAIQIVMSLPIINQQLQVTANLGGGLRAGATCDVGTVPYSAEAADIIAGFADQFINHDRSIGGPGSVVITERVYKQLPPPLHDCFAALGAWKDLGTAAYLYSPDGPRAEGPPPPPPTRNWSSLGAGVLGCPSQLPNVPVDFVGREDDVTTLVHRISRGDHSARVAISALKGMGGIGKTTLAVRVAHEIRDQFPDAQLYLDLRGVSLAGDEPVSAAEAMASIIRDLQPAAGKLPKDYSRLRSRYRSVLAGRRALIVLDNAASESQVADLIAGNATGFIITSRNALALDGVTSFEVRLFTPGESLVLLRAIVGAKGTDGELARVAELCGQLPLAVRVAGAFLHQHMVWTPEQYIDALRGESLRWLRVGDDRQRHVDAVLKLSAAQLARDDLSLATRWHFLADWPNDFACDAVAAAWDMTTDAHAVRTDLSTLLSRSLILYDGNSERYRLHDLMKPIARGLFGG